MPTITITDHPGRCRWCGCTEFNPCPVGCSWANRALTLCSACVEFDRLMRTARGRRELIQRWQDDR